MTDQESVELWKRVKSWRELKSKRDQAREWRDLMLSSDDDYVPKDFVELLGREMKDIGSRMKSV